MRGFAAAMFVAGIASVVAAQGATRRTSEGVYTAAQAARGKMSYAASCAACHGGALAGVELSPPLAGQHFLANWMGQPLDVLVLKIRTTMPQDDPGALGTAATAEVVAYILEANGFHPGTLELAKETAGLRQIVIDDPGASR